MQAFGLATTHYGVVIEFCYPQHMPPTNASSPTRTEIFFRLVKEFWLPASIAAAWTVYVIWGGMHDVKAVVGTFVTTLFLVSWFTGQIFRVSKQSAVDKNLRMIEGRLTNLLGRVEEGTRELIAQMTGGDSICDVQFVDPNETNTRFLMSAGVRGKYALREVSINIIDVGELEKISEAWISY